MANKLIECDAALILTDEQLKTLEPLLNVLEESGGGSIIASLYESKDATKGLCFKFIPLDLKNQIVDLTIKFFEGETNEKT